MASPVCRQLLLLLARVVSVVLSGRFPPLRWLIVQVPSHLAAPICLHSAAEIPSHRILCPRSTQQSGQTRR